VNLLRIIFVSFLLLLPAFCLTGCATAESDADDIADNAIQGLEGKGHLYNEKVMKGDMGGQFGNDFQ
jgi:predicted small secreted protein